MGEPLSARIAKLSARAAKPPPSLIRIRAEVEALFSDEDRENLVKYLDWLHGNICSSIRAIKRTVALMLALIGALYLIINSSSKVSFAILSFTIPKNPGVSEAILAIAAFLFLQMIQDSIDVTRSKVAFSKAFELLLGEPNGVDEYLWPPSLLYWEPILGSTVRRPSGYVLRHILNLAFALPIGSIIGYAYYQLLQRAHLVISSNLYFILWCVSVVFSALFMLAVVVFKHDEVGGWRALAAEVWLPLAIGFLERLNKVLERLNKLRTRLRSTEVT